MKLLILITSFFAVYCRAQNQDANSPQPVNNLGTPVKVTTLPFYGGAHGQYLEIYETANGEVSTHIIMKPSSANTPQSEDEIRNYTALEYPELPSKYDNEYGYNIKNIHQSAINIIKLQENAKKRGYLTDEEQTVYDRNTRVLNKSAKDLAELQLSEDDNRANDEGLKQWFEKKRNDSRKQQKPKDENRGTSQNKFWGSNNKQEEKEKEKPEKEELDIDDDEEDEDTIIINLPPDEASVAEAKPVGLAVAGAGGIAESKPIATAVVGPAGLAIARPVGTAIAGVSPDQALVPIYVEGFVKPSKKKDPPKGNKKSESVDFLSRIISKYHQV